MPSPLNTPESTRFQAGMRVKVRPEHAWAAGAHGLCTEYPVEVHRAYAKLWPPLDGPPEGALRLRSYWVEFDEPQTDARGQKWRAGEVAPQFLVAETEDETGPGSVPRFTLVMSPSYRQTLDDRYELAP